MLNQVLSAIEKARGPITIAELSRKLSIDAPALEGMIEFWIRKGRLQRDTADDTPNCNCGPGASTCAPISGCRTAIQISGRKTN